MKHKTQNTAFSRGMPVAVAVAIAAVGLFLSLAPHRAQRLVQGMADLLDAHGGNRIALAAGSEGGAYFRLGTVLQDEFAQHSRYRLEPLPTAGSMDNLRRLRDGEVDVALVQGGPQMDPAGLAGLATLGLEYVHVIAPADSAIQTFRDLAGKRVGVGAEQSGSEALARSIFDFFAFHDPPALVSGHAPGLEQAFLDGQIDAAFTVYGLFAPVMETLLQSGYYRLVPIPEAAALAEYVAGVKAALLPDSLYGPSRSLPPANGAPFMTLSVDTLMVAREDASPQQVRALLERLYHSDFTRRARLQHVTEASGQQVAPWPLHAAARAFYDRNAPVSSDRFEIASFFLAGVVCLASTTHYLLRQRERRHRYRQRQAIMPFFKAMMDFGQAVEKADNVEELTGLLNEMMATQRQAERAWFCGELNTEHMDNLYAVYNIRSRNAFSKISKLQWDAVTDETPQDVSGEMHAHHGEDGQTPTSDDVPLRPPREQGPLEYGTGHAGDDTCRSFETRLSPVVEPPQGEGPPAPVRPSGLRVALEGSEEDPGSGQMELF